MTTINFISGRKIHCDEVSIDGIKRIVRDQEGIPLSEQVIEPCWDTFNMGDRGSTCRGNRGRQNICVSMRSRGGRFRGHCRDHADLLQQAKEHESIPEHIKTCCRNGHASFDFLLYNSGRGGTRTKSCQKRYNCRELNLPSGNLFDNFKLRNDACGHLKREFCNHGNHLELYGKSYCKFCMAHDSGCLDSKKIELCKRNKNINNGYYRECLCINKGPISALENKLVEYNGSNYACWSNECRNSTTQTLPRSDRFIPQLWWSSISACRTPSLCIMEFNDVDVEQYGGVVNFDQNCAGGTTTVGDVPSITLPTRTPSSTISTPTTSSTPLSTDSRPSLEEVEATEETTEETTKIENQIPHSILVVLLFSVFFIFVLIIKKRGTNQS